MGNDSKDMNEFFLNEFSDIKNQLTTLTAAVSRIDERTARTVENKEDLDGHETRIALLEEKMDSVKGGIGKWAERVISLLILVLAGYLCYKMGFAPV